jgi:hypothetical protein
MAKEEQIRRAIRELVGKTTDGGMLMEGKVNSVDWDKRTCEVVLDDGRVLPSVRLKSITDDKNSGLCLKPKKGSVVLVATVGEETEQFVCGFNEIEAIELNMQDVELVIDGGKVKLKAKEIELNGGNNKGLAVVDKIAARCNDFEKALNEIKTVFQSHTHHVTGIGAPTEKTILPLTYSVPNSTGRDFENDKVKH